MPIYTPSNFDLPEGIILVTLAPEPRTTDELNKTIEIANNMGGCDVILDMSDIDIITSSSLSKSMRLLKVLEQIGNRLILCGLIAATRGIFSITGVKDKFVFAENVDEALSLLRGKAYLSIYLRPNVDALVAENILAAAGLFMEELGFEYGADHEPVFATNGSGAVQ